MAAGRGPETDQAAAVGPARRLPSARLLIPALALAAALAAHSAVFGTGAPTAYLLSAGAALGLVLLGLGAGSHGALMLGALLAGCAAAAVPLLPALAAGKTPGAVLHGGVVWPQCLVLLFASRLLAELNRLRFAGFWKNPAGSPPAAQSFAAALLLGLCLTFLFYSAFGTVPGAPAHDPLAVLRRALAAPSLLHAAILLVFLTLLAALLDAVLGLWAEERLLERFRATLEGEAAPGAERLAALLGHPGPLPAHSRVRAAASAVLWPSPPGSPEPAIEAVHAAARRFMRTLLSFLPLLGFLGTVVGLAIAIAGLDSRGATTGGADLAASLAGLALQFETTLLGLLGGLIAALAIALVDKREAELLAAARHVVAQYRAGVRA